MKLANDARLHDCIEDKHKIKKNKRTLLEKEKKLFDWDKTKTNNDTVIKNIGKPSSTNTKTYKLNNSTFK